jgi:Zn-dependent protease with chaperone function
VTRLLLALVTLATLACGAEQVAPTADIVPDALTFRAPAEHADAVQNVLARWTAATCLDLRVTDDGAHTVTYTNHGFATADRWGQVTGSWTAATIRIRTEMLVRTSRGPVNQVQEDDQRAVLTHELGHLLAMSNAHSAHGLMSDNVGEDVIDAELLESVCAVRRCGCFNPE